MDVARRQGIRHEVLSTNDLMERFPQFRWSGDELAYYEPEAGYVRPEACVAAQLVSRSWAVTSLACSRTRST